MSYQNVESGLSWNQTVNFQATTTKVPTDTQPTGPTSTPDPDEPESPVTMEICPKGQYRGPDTKVFTNCITCVVKNGQYQDEEGQHLCKHVHPGKYIVGKTTVKFPFCLIVKTSMCTLENTSLVRPLLNFLFV